MAFFELPHLGYGLHYVAHEMDFVDLISGVCLNRGLDGSNRDVATKVPFCCDTCPSA